MPMPPEMPERPLSHACLSDLLAREGATFAKEMNVILTAKLEQRNRAVLAYIQRDKQEMLAKLQHNNHAVLPYLQSDEQETAPHISVTSSKAIEQPHLNGHQAMATSIMTQEFEREDSDASAQYPPPYERSRRSISSSLARETKLARTQHPASGHRSFCSAVSHALEWLTHDGPENGHQSMKAHAKLQVASKRSNSTLSREDSEIPEFTITPSGHKEYKTEMLREIANQHSLQRGSFVKRLVASQGFEVASALAIICCVLMMALEIQYAGLEAGHELQVRNYSRTAAERWPGFYLVSYNLQIFFSTIFSIELLLRLMVLGCAALRSGWIWFDFVLVGISWAAFLSVGNRSAVDPLVLRVARVGRMARLLKVFKAMQCLDSLWILIKSVHASVSACAWSVLFLFMVHCSTAIFVSQVLSDFITDTSKDEAIRRQVFRYFGTFTMSIFSMFEIGFANWIPISRFLTENVSEWWGMFFMLYCGCLIFCVTRVIAAVFISETTFCLNNDDAIAISRAQRTGAYYHKKLSAIFSEIDDSNDGLLSWDEFMHLTNDELLRSWLTTLGVDTHNLGELYAILDIGDPDLHIDLEEFTSGMTRVRGPAKSLDVLRLQTTTKQLSEKLDFLIEATAASQASPRQRSNPRLLSPRQGSKPGRVPFDDL